MGLVIAWHWFLSGEQQAGYPLHTGTVVRWRGIAQQGLGTGQGTREPENQGTGVRAEGAGQGTRELSREPERPNSGQYRDELYRDPDRVQGKEGAIPVHGTGNKTRDRAEKDGHAYIVQGTRPDTVLQGPRESILTTLSGRWLAPANLEFASAGGQLDREE